VRAAREAAGVYDGGDLGFGWRWRGRECWRWTGRWRWQGGGGGRCSGHGAGGEDAGLHREPHQVRRRLNAARAGSWGRCVVGYICEQFMRSSQHFAWQALDGATSCKVRQSRNNIGASGVPVHCRGGAGAETVEPDGAGRASSETTHRCQYPWLQNASFTKYASKCPRRNCIVGRDTHKTSSICRDCERTMQTGQPLNQYEVPDGMVVNCQPNCPTSYCFAAGICEYRRS
jgi:hypothetical protein